MHNAVSAPPACRLILAVSLALAAGSTHAGTSAPAPDPAAARREQVEQLRQQVNWTQALAACLQALREHPDDPGLQRLRVRILADAGAAGLARDLASQLPAGSDPGLLARLDADVAAHAVRRARLDPTLPGQSPYAAGDRALGRLDDILRTHAADAPRVVARARLDRLVALQVAGRAADVERAYDALSPARRDALPAYVSRAVADALLQRRRPEEAARLLERAGADRPGGGSAKETDPAIALMYAYSESGRYGRARALIDAAAAAQPVWLHHTGEAAPVANPRRSEDDLNAALLYGYWDLLESAWTRLQAGVREAPDAVDWRRELGNIERARGWPRRAEADLAIAHGIDPRDLETRLARVDTWRALGDYGRVEPALRPLEARYPRSARVRQARRDWDRQRGWQLDADETFGRGNAPDYGDRDRDGSVTLASPLLADHWRVYAVGRESRAALPEGDARHRELGLGLRTEWRGLQAYLQALPSLDAQAGGSALEAGFDWDLDDHWNWTAAVSSNGSDLPLRARRYGIHARTWRSAWRWRSSELLSAHLDLEGMRFSDGNRRRSVEAGAATRVLTRPRLQVDAGASLYASRNSEGDRPYFNPSRDRAATLDLHAEHVIAQRYERIWQQSLDLSLGDYAQRGFASGWTADLGYGQRYQMRAGLAFGWRLGWHSQPYDGRREARTYLDLTLHWGE